jgi:hypothetical protein
LWLKRILLKFQYIEKKNDICKEELLEFTETLSHECENKSILTCVNPRVETCSFSQ